MLNRIKNQVRIAKFVVTANKEAAQNPASLFVTMEDLTKETEYGIAIIHRNAILASAGIVIAALMTFKPMFSDAMKAIVVDDNFYKLDEETRKFIIYHELGHLHHGHDNEGVSAKEYSLHRALTSKYAQQEIEADTYAAGVVGYDAAYRALKQVNEFCSLFTNSEMKCRLKNAKRLRSGNVVIRGF